MQHLAKHIVIIWSKDECIKYQVSRLFQSDSIVRNLKFRDTVNTMTLKNW